MLGWLGALACRADAGGRDAEHAAASPPAPTPAAYRDGERWYDADCAGCHGVAGRGTAQGPPLVHRVYEPRHHGDAAFHLAVRNGVAAHHWRFGNMPAQPRVSDTQTAGIVAYVRWLQREAGIR